MIEFEDIILIGWALAGAGLSQLLEYYYVRQHNLNYSLEKGLLVTAASGLCAFLYYFYVDSSLSSKSIMLHYGFFLALTIEVTLETISISEEVKPQPVFSAVAIPKSGTLIVSGFFSVYTVGCFGALVTEFILIYKLHHSKLKRNRKLLNERTSYDWALSILFVLIGGGIVVVHGISEVSALTAMQLGAAGPLAGSRVK